jgi:alpha-beta hydrolase superfamily lysophospholipase
MSRFLALFAVLPFVTPLAAQETAYKPVAEVCSDFLKLLDRPKVAANAKTIKTTPNYVGDWTLEELDFASEKKADGTMERVPTLILHPAKTSERLPAVIVLHGTGGSAQSQLGFMKELQARGIIGVAIDARYHGHRSGGAKGSAAYVDAIARAWKTSDGKPMEHPFYYDTVWDLWRLLDYLETRPDVDAKRLGMIGFSMGGIETWLAASVDERVRVSVPAIAVQSFKWSLDNDQWQGRANTIKAAHLQAAKDLGESAVNQRVCRVLWSKIIPGILDEFDCPSMMRLFAGRPMMIVSGTQDKNCPYGGAKLAIAATEKAYRDAGATDKLRVMVAEVGHTVTAEQRQAALEWFDRWFKK